MMAYRMKNGAVNRLRRSLAGVVLACLILVIAGLPVAQVAWAFDAAPAFSDPVKQERYERLGQELRCLVCQNQTIGDSSAELASDLRRELKELIAAGKTDAEIMKYMTDRYGDFVLFRPPVKPLTWLLWGAPVILLLIGLGSAVVIITKKARLVDNEPDEAEVGKT